MRRFSQRNSLVTLSDINITPLLDLAFVLLIIFVITTPLLDQSIDIKLPEGGRASTKVERDDLRVIEIDRTGRYKYDRHFVSLDELEQALVRAHEANPDIIVVVRCDKQAFVNYFYQVYDRCIRNGIRNLSLKTEPPGRS